MKRHAASDTKSQATSNLSKEGSRKRSRPVRSKDNLKDPKANAADTAGLQAATIAGAPTAAATALGAQSLAPAADALPRCKWVGLYRGAAAAEYVRYHDEEWGRPLHDDCKLFELLILEGAQAGLSWSTILAKRAAYRAAFAGFDPAKVAAFDEDRIEALLAEGSGVVRHKGKLASAVKNARVFLDLQRQHGSFDKYVWGFVPGSKPIINSWSSTDQVPSKTPEAEAMSKALKQAGMSFVGPTICYSFMQAAGLVNDHTVDCHCYQLIVDSCSREQQGAAAPTAATEVPASGGQRRSTAGRVGSSRA